MTTAADVRRELEKRSDAERAVFHKRYFKTGPGDYGEGDRFRGVKVPVLSQLSREHQDMPTSEVVKLLRSQFHEDRLLALVILVRQFDRGDHVRKSAIYALYMKSTRYINNWDMVDCSAPNIVGAHLRERSRAPIRRLARSANIWERRIAVLATFHFIRGGEFDESLHIAKRLLTDEEDLIHKAVGWMLREIGSRDQEVLEKFLRVNYRKMPRTMLRYAIERFPEARRQRYLKGSV